MSHDDHVTSDDLRGLEAHADMQFEVTGGRFSRSDNRFAAFDDRVDHIEQRLQALAQPTGARCDETDTRIDVAAMWLGHVHLQLSSRMGQVQRVLRPTVVLGIVGTTVGVALSCLGTMLLSR